MTKIFIRPNEVYELHFANGTQYELSGEGILAAIDIDFIMQGKLHKERLKEMYVSISRAVEEGNDLKMGIVIGQVMANLNEIINETN